MTGFYGRMKVLGAMVLTVGLVISFALVLVGFCIAISNIHEQSLCQQASVQLEELQPSLIHTGLGIETCMIRVKTQRGWVRIKLESYQGRVTVDEP